MGKKMRIIMIITTIFCIALGVALIAWPEQSRRIICYVIGGLVTAYGVTSIALYFAEKAEPDGMQFGLAVGCACVLIGVFLLIRAEKVMQALEMIIGVAVIIDSVIRLQITVNIRRLGGSFDLALLICALVTLAIGALLLFNPFASLQTATIACGVALIVDGLLTLWSMIQLGVARKKTPAVSAPAQPGTPAE